MKWGSRYRWFAVTVLLLAFSSTSRAQVTVGDLHATLGGQLTGLYNDVYGNLDTHEHSLGFAGNGQLSGDYYNPSFLSFSLLPYYGRSQANANAPTVFDASGYTGVINLFSGSHFPGFVSGQQNWNSAGSFGLPGLPGLTTSNNNHGFNVGWSELLPGFPTLTATYGDTSGTSSVLGSELASASTVHSLNLLSTYAVGGFYLSGGFLHTTVGSEVNGLENGLSETADGSTNQFRANARHGIPYRNSSFSLGFNRTYYNTEDSFGEKTNGTADNVNGIATLNFPTLPVTVTGNYTDNAVATFEQQLISNGQAPLFNLTLPTARQFSFEASTFYTILPNFQLGGFVQRVQEYIGPQSFGSTQYGLNASYTFLRQLKGLVVNAGLVDSATQQGNTHIGAVGNATYYHTFGKWEIGPFVRYDQNTQTLYVTYTTSTLNYGGSVKYELRPDWRWVNIANVLHSVLEQNSGVVNRGENFLTAVVSRRFSVSGNYSTAYGQSILTTSGLVPLPLPPSLLPPSNLITYSGRAYGASVGTFPLRKLNVNVAWTKSFGNTTSPTFLNNSGNTNYYGLMTYEYRKLLFTALVNKFDQHIFPSTTVPSMVTAYSFGVTRWFKLF